MHVQEAVARTPIPSESPLNATINNAGVAAGKAGQLKFAEADSKMLEQLSSKLMPPNEARHNPRNLMTANDMHAAQSTNSKHSGGPRGHRPNSAGSSPRCAIFLF